MKKSQYDQDIENVFKELESNIDQAVKNYQTSIHDALIEVRKKFLTVH